MPFSSYLSRKLINSDDFAIDLILMQKKIILQQASMMFSLEHLT